MTDAQSSRFFHKKLREFAGKSGSDSQISIFEINSTWKAFQLTGKALSVTGRVLSEKGEKVILKLRRLGLFG